MKGNLHSIESFGAVDGPGIRTVFFMQGCPARCLYCHNPDSWKDDVTGGEGWLEVSDIVHWADRGKPYHGAEGGVTFSGGEPLMQGQFLSECIDALHADGIRSVAVDTSGTYIDEYTEEVISKCDLVLLDIKHPDPERFKIVTGCDQEKWFELLDIINRLDKHVWVRYVIVPDINDTPEDIELLNEFMTRIRNIDKVELLGYHNMAVNKYARLNMVYRLKGVPPMDGAKLKELQAMVKYNQAGK